MINFENGDSIKFGDQYCKEFRREELRGKTIMMTPQYFEDDNGLYVYTVECAGMWDEENQEADSIYHLFGNDFEWFMDCKLIKGTEEDKQKYQSIIDEHNERLEKEAEGWLEFAKENGF